MAEIESLNVPYVRPPQGGAPAPAKPLAADLLAVRELQASLGLEDAAEAVVRVGTNATVEILAVECGLTFIDAEGPHPALRFGWGQGRTMPAAEADALERGLEGSIDEVRSGRAGSLLLGPAGTQQAGGSLPAALRARGFGAVLILSLGSGGRRTGAMVLLAREPEAFSGEPMILAEILAAETADHVERVRLRVGSGNGAAPARPPAGGDSRVLAARNAALEAQAAIAAAAAPGLDADRQVEMALKQAIALSGHAAGAIYLVETCDTGDDIVRFARGQGDPAWLELARLPRWRKGEGMPGRVWESGEGVAFGEIAEDPAGFGLETLHRAGYRRMCCEPLRARGRTIGILEMFGSESRPYDDTERGLLRAIADQVGTAIHNARLLADVMRHSLDLEWQVERLGTERARVGRERDALAALLATASAEHEPEMRAAVILERLLAMTGADAAALLTVGAGPAGLRLVAQRGFPDAAADRLYQRPVDDPVLRRGIEAGGAVVVDLADESAIAAGWPRLAGYRHAAVVPCRSGESLRGVILLATRYAGNLGEEMRSGLDAVAGLATLVLESGQRAELPRVRSEQRAAPDVPAGPGEDPEARPAAAAPPAERLALAQKMESLGRLAPGVVHCLNNAMAAIMGHASHIRSLVPDHNPVHDKAAVIVEASQRAADLVQTVLDFSHGSTGRREPIDLSPLVSETLGLLSRTLDPSVVVEARCAAALPPVDADPGEMRQVLLNLAVNAKDALAEGGRIVFETRAGHLDEQVTATMPGLQPGDYVSIVVTDNGVGMPPEVIAHAFEPFYTTKPIAQGSGLGLTVVQEIVRRHGGHVALSSAPTVGTAVRVYLPVITRPPAGANAAAVPGPAGVSTAEVPAMVADDAPPNREDGGAVDPDHVDGGRADADPAARDEADTLRTEPGDDAPADPADTDDAPWLRTRPLQEDSTTARILVVDDEPVLREMTAEMLTGRGYEVLTAGDGVEALEIYRREWGTISLVVLDLVMPRLGGLETFRRLTGMDRKARILLCSGQTHSQQAHQAVLEGAIGLLPKPFGIAELLGWVERGLRS
jgi:signal transduction histidine kinase